MSSKQKLVPIIPMERIMGKIYYIRGKKVMFDRDLAELYGVAPKVLNQAVKRNAKRFPDDFMFKLSKEEMLNWKSQIVTLKTDANLKSQIVTSSWGGARKIPHVFTEQGVAMLSSVLNSDRAVQVNIQIIRTFIKIRELLIGNAELRAKIELMEKKYDNKFKIVFDAIESIIETKEKDIKPASPIGLRG